MDAVISGRAGKAIVLDGDALMSVDLNDALEFVPRRPADIRVLLGESNDAIVIENATREEIIHRLEIEQHFATALDLTLISLDPELSDEVRMEAVETLDELLADVVVVVSVESTLYAKPLPDGADVMGALAFCEGRDASISQSFFERLGENQPGIRNARYAWESIPLSVFGGARLKSEFHDVAVRESLFRELSTSGVDQASVGLFLLNALRNESVRALRNHRDVLRQWAAPLRDGALAGVTEPEVTREAAEELEPKIGRDQRRGRPRRRQRGDAILEKVESQKGLIISAMKRRDYVRAHEVIEELIDFQCKNGRPEHLAKSLCDLAKEAKELGSHSLQLELTTRSIQVRPEDAWSWAQHGDALLTTGRLGEALYAYEQADAFGNGPVTTGRAEVLKAQGRLSEAMEAFDGVIESHPENVVAKNGRAEVLKVQGRLSEALEAFDAVIAVHSEDVVAKTGRAEVLKAQGRLSEALEAFEDAIESHPENVVAKTGRAEVLKAQGRLSEALEAFDAVIAVHSEDVFAKTGRAEVLKAQGRLSEALEAFEDAIESHPENVVAKNGRAEVLKAQGRLSEALEAFEAAIESHPEDVVAKNGRAEVLKAQGRLSEALEAFEATIESHPENVVAKNGRAEVLKAQGRLREALEAFDAVIAVHSEDVVAKSGRSCILASLGLYAEALEHLPLDNPSTEQDWIGYHIRGMTLLRMGDIEGANRVFESGKEFCPWGLSKPFFIASLALTRVRRREFADARDLLENIVAPAVQPQLRVLRVHALGELKERERAIEVYSDLKNNPRPFSDELPDELYRRYIAEQGPLHDDEWVYQKEVDLFLLAAQELAATRNPARQMR